MIRTLRVGLLAVLLLACTREEPPSAASQDPIPLIVIALDTLRADHLPTYGYDRATAPALARLARESVVFSNAASQASQTLISFKSFFAASYPHAILRRQGHSMESLASVASENATQFVTRQLRSTRANGMLNELGRQGYLRAAFADGGWVSQSSGFHHGFDHFDSHREGLAGRIPAAKKWMEAHEGKPYFLLLHAYDVHCPYATREPYQSEYHEEHGNHEALMNECFKAMTEARDLVEDDLTLLVDHYDSGVLSADAYVGQFLDELREAGIYERALIVLTSDHREAFGERSVGGKYMIGHGGLYPEQLHIPLFIKFPRESAIPPRRIDQPVELLDVMPTLVDFVGGRLPPGIDGRSLMPLIRGETEEHRDALTAQLSYVVLPTRQTSRGTTSRWIPGRSLVLREEFEGAQQAYDLTRDPGAARAALSAFEGIRGSKPEKVAIEALELEEGERAQLRALGYLE